MEVRGMYVCMCFWLCYLTHIIYIYMCVCVSQYELSRSVNERLSAQLEKAQEEMASTRERMYQLADNHTSAVNRVPYTITRSFTCTDMFLSVTSN